MSMDSKQPPSSPRVRALGEHFETALDRAARAAEPPDYDQLAAYVDGTLDDVDREIVESWLEADPALRAEVEDLRALHGIMSQPAATLASAAAAGAAASTSSESTRLSGHAASVAARDAAVAGPEARPSSSKVVSFEEAAKRTGVGTRRRLGTATLIMGAMAAAVIAATTWLAVRTARSGGGPATADSRVARDRELPSSGQAPSPQTPVPAPNTSASQVAANPSVVDPSVANPSVVIRDADGPISVDAAGTVIGLTADAAASPQMTRLVADALTTGAVPRAAATAGLGGRELTLMGGSQSAPTRLAPLSPLATVVRSAQPVFRWSAHPGARNYVVTIYGPDFDRVMASPVVTDTSWTASSALKPGVTYQWQVTADTTEGPIRAPAPPAADARFRIIDAAVGKTLDRDLARAGSSQLLKGLLLAQAGVLDEAEAAFEALRVANPESKRVADLLARVRDRRMAP